MINPSHLFLILTITMGALGFVLLHGAVATVALALSMMFFVLMLASVITHEIQRHRH